jgi:type II secretory pathway predicted ATPase ExeA
MDKTDQTNILMFLRQEFLQQFIGRIWLILVLPVQETKIGQIISQFLKKFCQILELVATVR